MCNRNHLVRRRGSAHGTSGQCPFHITKFSPGRSCWAHESYSCPEYLMEISLPLSHMAIYKTKYLSYHYNAEYPGMFSCPWHWPDHVGRSLLVVPVGKNNPGRVSEQSLGNHCGCRPPHSMVHCRRASNLTRQNNSLILTHWPLGDKAVILIQWGQHKMTTILQVLFTNAFCLVLLTENFWFSNEIPLKCVP